MEIKSDQIIHKSFLSSDHRETIQMHYTKIIWIILMLNANWIDVIVSANGLDFTNISECSMIIDSFLWMIEHYWNYQNIHSGKFVISIRHFRLFFYLKISKMESFKSNQFFNSKTSFRSRVCAEIQTHSLTDKIIDNYFSLRIRHF